MSLTAEEVQLPPGTRPKMPTLLGLGAALETPPLPLVARSAASLRSAPADSSQGRAEETRDVEPAALGVSGADPSPVESPVELVDRAGTTAASSTLGVAVPPAEPPVVSSTEAPGEPEPDAARVPVGSGPLDDITAPVQLLADFALKLSLGPVSQLWVPGVRRAADALLLTAGHRHETALAALSSRLLALLGGLAGPVPASANGTASAGSDGNAAGSLEGELRDQVLHEVSRLAGVLPEWPAPAQDLADEARRRETRVMRELLAVVDGFKRDQRARLEETTRLEELSGMAPAVISEEFEVPLERAEELRRVLDAYREEQRTRVPDVDNALGLSLSIECLAETSRAFADCDAEQKEPQRVLRLKRRRALTTVNLLLAERGEFEWLDQLEPLSIDERIERLKQWLDTSIERTC